MKKHICCCLSFLLCLTVLTQPAFALSTRHHLYNMGKSLVNAVKAPIQATLVEGPKRIHKMYQYEVNGRENLEDRGKMKYRFFSLWRAPGEQTKAMLDGVADTVSETTNFGKEFLSIFFSD